MVLSHEDWLYLRSKPAKAGTVPCSENLLGEKPEDTINATAQEPLPTSGEVVIFGRNPSNTEGVHVLSDWEPVRVGQSPKKPVGKEGLRRLQKVSTRGKRSSGN